MVKKYYNNIKKEQTQYPCRFKTIDEMKNEYLKFMNVEYPEEDVTFNTITDYDWRSYIDCYFSKEMDYMAGNDIEIEDISIDSEYIYRLSNSYNGFTISTMMLVKNDESPLYNMVSNKRKNIYENNVLKFNESMNEKNEANSICVYIKDRKNLFEFDLMLLETKGVNQDLYRIYSNSLPIYFFVNFNNERIYWLSGENDELGDSYGIGGRSYLDGVYKNVFIFEKDKQEIQNIIKNKKIDYIPYFIKTPKNIYESIDTKPYFFKQTYYRLPNNDELNDIINHNLTAKQVLDGFNYTIVGRGIMNSKNKDMIIQSIKNLIILDGDNMDYKNALKQAEKIIIK